MYALWAFRRHRAVPLATFIGIHEKRGIVDIKDTVLKGIPINASTAEQEESAVLPSMLLALL